MGAADIDEKNKRPLHGVYAGNSDFNAFNQQIEARIQRLETMFLGRVDSCQSSGVAGSKTVGATPMSQMIDGNGNAYASPSYPSLPHYRIQQGTAAIIMNPRPGDIGVFICSKRDISNVSQGKQPGPPGSTRSFSASDAVMVGSIHTKEPTYYISFEDQDKILIHAPAGVTIESDTAVTVKAPQVTIDAAETTIKGHVTVEGGLNVAGGSGAAVDGSLTTTGDVTADGISLTSHTHSGVTPGGGNTGGPN